MSVLNIIRIARAAGAKLIVDGSSLVLEAESPPPPQVFDMLRAHKPEILELLQAERRALCSGISPTISNPRRSASALIATAAGARTARSCSFSLARTGRTFTRRAIRRGSPNKKPRLAPHWGLTEVIRWTIDAGCQSEACSKQDPAAIADRVTRIYFDAWARLNHRRPEGVMEGEWRQALDDGGIFLDNLGTIAGQLKWTPGSCST